MFLGSTCTHCHIKPGLSCLHRGVYTRSVRPSRKKKVGKTTASILGRLIDDRLLDTDHIEEFDGLPAYLAKALHYGCWDAFAGRQFECRNEKKHVEPKNEIYQEVRWYYLHWTSVDYGFNVSSALSHSLARRPATEQYLNGCIYLIDEYVASHRTRDFSQDVKHRWHIS